MRAIVLAGGQGARLRPYTFSIPKPLLPVGDKAVLELVLENLLRNDIDEVFLALGYKAELIQAYAQQLPPKWHFEFVTENKRLGTAGPLKLVAPLLGYEPVAITNADIATPISFKAMFAQHSKGRADITVAARLYEQTSPFGVLELDGHTVMSVKEKPKRSDWIAAGAYIMSRDVFDLIPQDQYFDIPDLIEAAMREGLSVQAFKFEEPWIAIEELADFKRLTELKLD